VIAAQRHLANRIAGIRGIIRIIDKDTRRSMQSANDVGDDPVLTISHRLPPHFGRAIPEASGPARGIQTSFYTVTSTASTIPTITVRMAA